MKTLPTLLMLALVAATAYPEGRTPYRPVVKAAMLKSRIMADGEPYVRFLMKPNSDDIRIESVIVTIERDGRVLKTIHPTLRDLREDSSDEYPWEILLPIDEKYLKNTELVHNQAPGSLGMSLRYKISGKTGSGSDGAE